MKLPLKISDLSDDTNTFIEDANRILMFQSVGGVRLKEAKQVVEAINGLGRKSRALNKMVKCTNYMCYPPKSYCPECFAKV